MNVIHLAMPATSGTGSGTGDGAIVNRVMAETPDGRPNTVIAFVQPIVAILIRATNAFLVSFSGAIGMDTATELFTHSDAGLHLEQALLFAAGAAFVSIIKNSITVFSGLETKYPLSTGNV